MSGQYSFTIWWRAWTCQGVPSPWQFQLKKFIMFNWGWSTASTISLATTFFLSLNNLVSSTMFRLLLVTIPTIFLFCCKVSPARVSVWLAFGLALLFHDLVIFYPIPNYLNLFSISDFFSSWALSTISPCKARESSFLIHPSIIASIILWLSTLLHSSKLFFSFPPIYILFKVDRGKKWLLSVIVIGGNYSIIFIIQVLNRFIRISLHQTTTCNYIPSNCKFFIHRWREHIHLLHYNIIPVEIFQQISS